ncbi:hypothetical protein BSKO_01689 [Bryopsis sp. KO-2023]|nr:hypothetical protein BSKO_01689 [Bryopsis sp. KO-2023]
MLSRCPGRGLSVHRTLLTCVHRHRVRCVNGFIKDALAAKPPRDVRRFCGVKVEFRTPEEKEEFIRQRIEESHRRAASRKIYECVGCSIQCGRPDKMMVHMSECCPDLLVDIDLESVDESNIDAVLEEAAEKEGKLMDQAIFLEFQEPTMLGMDSKRNSAEVAQLMDLPHDRARLLMKRALKRIPLVADSDPIDVVFEDDAMIVVNKVPFIITAPKHRYAGGTMVNRVIGHLGKEPFVVHRLDMNTTGVLVMAKSSRDAAAIHYHFRHSTVNKWYLAVVAGLCPEPKFSVDAPIDRETDHNIARTVLPSGQQSLTDFWVLDSNPEMELDVEGTNRGWYAEQKDRTIASKGVSLVLCRPKTGRTHQIRVHLAHRDIPIIGDEIYGLEGPWIDRQALHAWAIAFPHPTSSEPMQLKAEEPNDFKTVLKNLGLTMPKNVDLKARTLD